jgi:D-alanyl-D-alanine carboxypeptidase
VLIYEKSVFPLALCALAALHLGKLRPGGGDPFCQRAILIHADTGTVLYEKNADERALIASTTKIMTALVALEHCALDGRRRSGRRAL